MTNTQEQPTTAGGAHAGEQPAVREHAGEHRGNDEESRTSLWVERARNAFFGADAQDRTAKDWGIDAAVALGAFAFACCQMLLMAMSVVFFDTDFRELTGMVNHVPNGYAYVVVALTTLPLALRRAAPWPVLAIILACFWFFSRFMGSTMLSCIGPVVAVFTVASERGRRQGLVAMGIAMLVCATAATPYFSEMLSLVLRVQNTALVAAGAFAGFALYLSHAVSQETKRRLEEAERSKEELAARRVAEERVRIARDVHDITAHSLSAVAIQAAAAERLIDANPAAAREAVADIRAVSKSALEEIRSMVGVLRGEGEAAQHAPAEGTERMADVVEYLRRAGIEVHFSERGYDKESVPAFVDMALFVLAREAATNAVRHARASRVEISLRSTATEASMLFSDNGIGMSEQTRADASGHGLRGMAERIEALHGSFTVKSADGAGCAIEARIPLEGGQ